MSDQTEKGVKYLKAKPNKRTPMVNSMKGNIKAKKGKYQPIRRTDIVKLRKEEIKKLKKAKQKQGTVSKQGIKFGQPEKKIKFEKTESFKPGENSPKEKGKKREIFRAFQKKKLEQKKVAAQKAAEGEQSKIKYHSEKKGAVIKNKNPIYTVNRTGKSAIKVMEKSAAISQMMANEQDGQEQLKNMAVGKFKEKSRQAGKKTFGIIMIPVKEAVKYAGKTIAQALMKVIAAVGTVMGFPLLIFIVVAIAAIALDNAFGNITNADSMPLYLQYDKAWGNMEYGGEGGTVKKNGCGICSMAMVLSYWKGQAITPDQLVEQYHDEFYVKGVGTDMFGLAAQVCNDYEGMHMMSFSNNIDNVTEELKQGHTVIASAKPGIFTSSGHIIVLRGMDTNENILVNDPNDTNMKNHYNTPFAPKTIEMECKYYISMWGDVKANGDEAMLLAKLIQCEAGSNWVNDQHQRLVASVVINRVNSASYPNTITDVIYQKGQYAPAMNGAVDKATPSERAIRNANFVIENGPIDTQVVFQANFKQGTVKYTFTNPYLSESNRYKYTYFGY